MSREAHRARGIHQRKGKAKMAWEIYFCLNTQKLKTWAGEMVLLLKAKANNENMKVLYYLFILMDLSLPYFEDLKCPEFKKKKKKTTETKIK